MTGLRIGLLSVVIFLPTLGAIVLALLPRERDGLLRAGGLLVSVATFALSIPLWLRFDADNPDFQFDELLRWMPSLGVGYHVGIDGISLLLVLLTTLLTPVALASAWHSIEDRTKEFVVAMLVLETGMLGVFVALDLFLFFVFWEAMLIPMYFIIGVWGGANRLYAAIKFFIYTMAGSLLMLVAIVALVWRVRAVTGYLTFSYDLLLQHAGAVGALAPWLFAAFAIAFAIKVPIFPFHTWLPDAHVEAPTAGSVLLAAVMLKIGTYGFLRFAVPFFPHVALSPTVSSIIVVLAVIGVIYGALVAMVQPDIKKLVAYSSVSHLGFVMLGIWGGTLQSVQGSLMIMISHGFSTGALFLLIGMIYERRHTRLIEDYGGIARVVPIFSLIFTVVALSSIGLPGLNGFVGEFLVLLGSFGAYPVATVLATTGVIFAAAYLLWALQRMIFNRLDKPENEAIADLGRRELALMAPLLIGIVWLGLYPAPVLKRMESAARRYVELTQPARTNSPVAVQGASVQVAP
jgi:NADH-quinone oxidoreductase subunit M